MNKLEKVISSIKKCNNNIPGHCDKCPYRGKDTNDCVGELLNDALELLKEKQLKKGHWIPFDSKGIGDESDYQCSECFAVLNYEWLYCPGCGSYMIEEDGERK